MRVDAVSPSNGGVVIVLHEHSVEGPLGYGYVVEAGAGVPWLQHGCLVAFTMDKAQGVEVPRDQLWLDDIPVDTGHNVWVYLVEQRNVIARLSHLPMRNPR